jgi:hypothetical protein
MSVRARDLPERDDIGRLLHCYSTRLIETAGKIYSIDLSCASPSQSPA